MMKGPVERFQSTNRIFPGFTYIKANNTMQRKGQKQRLERTDILGKLY